MTHRERFIKTLKCEPIGGQVPTFELVFFLSMEAFGKVHPSQRHFEQWDQMSARERRLHIEDMADIYIRTAQRYDHSAIFIHPNPGGFQWTQVDLSKLPQNATDTLRIVRVGDYDACACAGDHVQNTCEIAPFKIISADFTPATEAGQPGRWRMRFKLLEG